MTVLTVPRSAFRRLRTLADQLRAVATGESTDDESASESKRGQEDGRDAGSNPVLRADGSGRAARGEQSTTEGDGCCWLPPSADPTPGVQLEDIETQSDIVQHVGLTPGEFVLALVERNNGRVEQQAFTEYTNLSESSLSRLLGDLETRGLGQRFPHRLPEDGLPPGGRAGSRPRGRNRAVRTDTTCLSGRRSGPGDRTGVELSGPAPPTQV